MAGKRATLAPKGRAALSCHTSTPGERSSVSSAASQHDSRKNEITSSAINLSSHIRDCTTTLEHSHFIAFCDGLVFGYGETFAECLAEAKAWSEGQATANWVHPATEAAFDYAREQGGDADYGKFYFDINGNVCRDHEAPAYRVSWVSEDGQASRSGPTGIEASGIARWHAEAWHDKQLRQAGDDRQRAAIWAGIYRIEAYTRES